MGKSARIVAENVRTTEGRKLRPSHRNDGKGRYNLRLFAPSVKQPSTVWGTTAKVPPVRALQPLGGGDGNGGDASTASTGQRGGPVSPETTDDRRVDVAPTTGGGEASAPNSPGAPHNRPEAVGEGGCLTDDQCGDGGDHALVRSGESFPFFR